VIVTYPPTANMIENLSEGVRSVQGWQSFDNGSDPDLSGFVPQSTLGFTLIENGENLCIAEALSGVLGRKIKLPLGICSLRHAALRMALWVQCAAAWQSQSARDRVAPWRQICGSKYCLELAVMRARKKKRRSLVTSMTRGH